METPSKAKRILYVEDNPLSREPWIPRFKEMGYEVEVADSVMDARRKFDKDKYSYSVAFVDLGLPMESDPDHRMTSNDDLMMGLELLEYLRGQVPDLGLIAYTGMPETKFSVELITRLVASQISFAPIRLMLHVEEVSNMVWFADRGFVVYPRSVSPMFKHIIIEPESRNPLDEWEYYILSLLAHNNTQDQIADTTDNPTETVREDFQDIYVKLERAGLIPPKEGERRQPVHLRTAYDKLCQKFGEAPRVTRPRRRARTF
jgi:DNA-binding NarL/FixJ family response regulator